jgi:glycopeptide antibiotics resistance protein
MLFNKKLNYTKIISMIIILTGISLVFLLSWKSNPNVSEFNLIPKWISKWADNNKNNRIRTGIPFLLLGPIISIYLKFYLKNIRLNVYILIFIILLSIVCIAELGQYFIPSRQPDIKDVIWGGIGATLGLAFIYVGDKLLTKLKKH